MVEGVNFPPSQLFVDDVSMQKQLLVGGADAPPSARLLRQVCELQRCRDARIAAGHETSFPRVVLAWVQGGRAHWFVR